MLKKAILKFSQILTNEEKHNFLEKEGFWIEFSPYISPSFEFLQLQCNCLVIAKYAFFTYLSIYC